MSDDCISSNMRNDCQEENNQGWGWGGKQFRSSLSLFEMNLSTIFGFLQKLTERITKTSFQTAPAKRFFTLKPVKQEADDDVIWIPNDNDANVVSN